MTPSASPDHNDAAFALCALLKRAVPANLRVGMDLDWVLAVPGNPRFIVNAPRPDVVVWPKHHALVAEPVLAAEVLSPSDAGRIEAKRFAYGPAGLASYLEIDLETGALRLYHLTGTTLIVTQSGSVITVGLPGCEPLSIAIDQLRP